MRDHGYLNYSTVTPGNASHSMLYQIIINFIHFLFCGFILNYQRYGEAYPGSAWTYYLVNNNGANVYISSGNNIYNETMN